MCVDLVLQNGDYVVHTYERTFLSRFFVFLVLILLYRWPWRWAWAWAYDTFFGGA